MHGKGLPDYFIDGHSRIERSVWILKNNLYLLSKLPKLLAVGATYVRTVQEH
jgi:hypothetical protein